MNKSTVMYDFVQQRDGWGVNVRTVDEKMWEAVYTEGGVSETCMLPCTRRHYDRGRCILRIAITEDTDQSVVRNDFHEYKEQFNG